MLSTRTFVLVLAAAMLAPALAVAMPLAAPVATETPAAPQVTIKRDAYGVPHVYADDVYSLFWGNGYAQAQDRLFQIDVLRHVGKGEAARFVGPSLLESDLATRRELYTDEERTAYLNALSPGDREMFQAYADGVNAWIAQTRANPSLLSAEFFALGHAPEDWVPEDTIAIAQYLLAIFGFGSGGNEVENAQLLFHLIDTLGEEEAEKAFNDLLWLHDAETYTTIPADEYVYPATEGILDFDAIPAKQWEVAKAAAESTPFAGAMSLEDVAEATGFTMKFGSNGVVLSPEHSESGNALLLGGPQMAYFNPMVPYEVALHGAGFEALGMGIGGAPGMIIGRTPTYSWTVTSGSSDQVDVVALELVPGNSRQYHGASGVTDMECRIETHVGVPGAVDQKPPVLAVQEVCRTERGPVFAMNEAAGYAFVKEMTHRYDELRSGILWLTLARSPDLQAFQAHMETFCFEFNFLQADNGGNIAYNHWGCQPVRDPSWDPRLPRLAGAADWQGIRSGSDLPRIENPAKGYLVNWNNKPAQGWSSGDALEKWGPVHRAELFEATMQKFLADDGKLDVDDLKAINVEISTRSPFPPNFVPRILAATASSPDATVQDARAALAAWGATGYGWEASDATCMTAKAPSACFGTYEPGFAIYEKWRGLAQERVFRDEMGPYVREMGFVPEKSSDPHAADHGREDNKDNTLHNALHGRAAHAWCDDVATNATESCDGMLAATFAEAVAALAAQYGTDDASEWRQPIHTIKFAGLSGGPSWRIPMVNRPSFNHLYDWGTGYAGSVLPPGTNQYWKPIDYLRYQGDGTMPDAHKRDQLDLYVAFEYKSAQMDPGAWESVETHVAAPPALI